MRIRSFNILIVSFLLLFVTASVSQLYAAPATSFKESRLKTVVKEYIHANAPWPQENVRIEFLGRIADVSVQGERINVKVRGSRDESYIGDSTFTVALYDEGTLLREIPVRVRMEVALDVVISTKFLRSNSEINDDDVKLARKWFNQIPISVVTQIEDAVGKYLYGDVRPNTEIKRSMLRSVKTIKRGKVVKMVLENGPMTIMTFGLCEEDGSRGDFIRVKNISSNKTVFARVLDSSSVRVEY
ncbi:MAG: flagellar basal body P-ring formation chaperone FlgA [Syntrophaceae bacterium]